DVELRGHARQHVLAEGGGGREDVSEAAGGREHLRGDVLGELVLQLRRIGEQHFRDAGRLCGGLRNGLAAAAGHEHGDVAADALRGGDRVERAGPQRGVVVFGQDENCHVVVPLQITLASFFSFATSVATSGTFTPALRAGGSLTFSVFSRGVGSTPRSSGLTTSSVFFFAFMMFGSVT